MEQHIKLFTNHSAYNAVKDQIDTPNVILCVQENEVHFTPIDPYGGHAYVDLGLPSGTLWATENPDPTKSYHYYDVKGTVYGSSAWGENWEIPSIEQIEELVNNTTYSWVENYQESGINGGLFTSSNGNVLFLPAEGTAFDPSNQVGFYVFKNVPIDRYEFDHRNPFVFSSSGAFPTGGYLTEGNLISVRYVVTQ